MRLAADPRTSFWTTRHLRARGSSKQDLADAVASGSIIRVRRGHYCAAGVAPELVAAVRVGGLATAATATRAFGLWTPPDDRLHVAVPATASRLHDPTSSQRRLELDTVCVHWGSRLGGLGQEPLVNPLVALEHAFSCMPAHHALAMADSAVGLRVVRRRDLAALGRALPERLRPTLDMVDGRAESGIESITRFGLELAGLTVQVQAAVATVGRVDLLVEGRLIVELDGRAFHTDVASFERDRHRDAAAARVRLRVLRFTYSQVLHEWPTVLAAVLAALD